MIGCAGKRVEAQKVPYWKGRFPVMVVAHRGFSGAAPENTLAAFRKAIAIGSDMIELDIHFSKDRKIVVIHDETLERTTDGTGKVVEHTLRDLKKLDAGSRFAADFAGERIPTLEEVLDLAQGRVLVNIEIKNPTHGQYSISDLADRALEAVKRARLLERVVFSSFNPAALEWIQQKEPQAKVAFLYHREWNSLYELPKGKDWPVLNLRNAYLTREKIAKIRKEGIIVNVYTVNTEEELEQFVRWGVDGIITNYPDRLIRILKAIPP
ncbi:MAG: glycerophosphodiester phosphodiesterase [Syntrophaceae bacterium]|nr:glycerophosphodiester phosphodiesterase [Syntrophaceae bacterium]